MSTDYVTKSVSLAYWLGEICLFRKTFELRVKNVEFLAHEMEDPQLLKPYGESTVNDNCGFMLYSVPLDQERADFWTEDGYVKYITKFYNHYYILSIKWNG